MKKNRIEELVGTSLTDYFTDLQGTEPAGIYDMVVHPVERAMLSAVMAQAQGNQLRAARWLGINRNTLRKKLAQHQLLSPRS